MSNLFNQSDIIKKLQKYCVYQDRCHKDISDKLKKMKIPYSLHDNIVVELIRGDFLNEQRFVFSFVRGKFRIKKWGKIKLERELFLRNITPALIKEAINTINEIDYLTTFNDISARKFDNLKNDKSLKSKNKFITYLQYRGWENDLIFSKVRELY